MRLVGLFKQRLQACVDNRRFKEKEFAPFDFFVAGPNLLLVILHASFSLYQGVLINFPSLSSLSISLWDSKKPPLNHI